MVVHSNPNFKKANLSVVSHEILTNLNISCESCAVVRRKDVNKKPTTPLSFFSIHWCPCIPFNHLCIELKSPNTYIDEPPSTWGHPWFFLHVPMCKTPEDQISLVSLPKQKQNVWQHHAIITPSSFLCSFGCWVNPILHNNTTNHKKVTSPPPLSIQGVHKVMGCGKLWGETPSGKKVWSCLLFFFCHDVMSSLSIFWLVVASLRFLF